MRKNQNSSQSNQGPLHMTVGQLKRWCHVFLDAINLYRPANAHEIGHNGTIRKRIRCTAKVPWNRNVAHLQAPTCGFWTKRPSKKNQSKLTSAKLTYPTNGKGNSSSKVPWYQICYFPRGYNDQLFMTRTDRIDWPLGHHGTHFGRPQRSLGSHSNCSFWLAKFACDRSDLLGHCNSMVNCEDLEFSMFSVSNFLRKFTISTRTILQRASWNA